MQPLKLQNDMEDKFERTIQALGEAAFRRLQDTRVILFGVGGVGGWCAEALVRTGLLHLTIVDFDVVNPSNINRQVVATSANIGEQKVEAMRKRLLEINPEADITALTLRYPCATLEELDFNQFDYIIDAIDSVADKALLIHNACASSATLFSSMGAGRKLDTATIRGSEFRKVEGCPLARALRTKMRKDGIFPQKKFQCVWSPEISSDSGTLASVVGIFGFTLANLVIRDIAQR